MNAPAYLSLPTILPAVMSAEEVARLLRRRSAQAFLRDRPRLEAAGFPKKLPGMNLWSGAAIMRWLETNGATSQPADDAAAGALAGAARALEQEYAR